METRQDKNKKWRSCEIIDVKWCDFQGLKDAIADAEQRLTDISFDVGTQPDYDCDVAYAHITGWRTATSEEIGARKDELAKAAAVRQSWEDSQVEALKRSRPELFK